MTELPGQPMVTNWPLVVTLLGAMVTLLGVMVTHLNFPKHVTPLLHQPFNWQPHFDTEAMDNMDTFPRLKLGEWMVLNIPNIIQMNTCP